jgi:hypothetical protein
MGADGEDEKKVSFALYLSQDNVFSLIWCAILFSKCFFTLRSKKFGSFSLLYVAQQ